MITRMLPLEGLVLVELPIHEDERGFFLERFHGDRFRASGLPVDFVQDNHSRSRPGVVRGLHYQFSPPQGKLVGVIRGRIWDVAVDIRRDSATWGRYSATELNDGNGRLLWIPAGFAHGFCVLGDEPADVLYKIDAPYDAQADGVIAWNDPDLAIPWPVQTPILSRRDRRSESFRTFVERQAVEEPALVAARDKPACV